MSIKNIEAKRTTRRLGLEKVVMIDANMAFGINLGESDPLRWLSVPKPGAFGDLEEFIQRPNPLFHFDTETVRYALAAYELARPVMMTGPTGAGKSDFFEQFCARLRLPNFRVQCSADLDLDSFFGSKGLKAGNTVFEEGVLTWARRNDVAVCLDEVDSLRENVQLSLNGYLENSSSVKLPNTSFNESPVVLETTGNQLIFATSNTGGKMQAAIGFNGTNSINKAVLDRFIHLEVDYLPSDVERKIVHGKTGLDYQYVDAMIQCASVVRQAYKRGEVFTTLSTRKLIDWANFGQMLSLNEGFQIACYAQAEPSDRSLFAQAFKTGMGTSLQLPQQLRPVEDMAA